MRRSLKRRAPPITLPRLPNRVAVDPPIGVKVIIDDMIDPYGIAESATPRRRGNSKSEEWFAFEAPRISVLRSIRADPLGWARSHSHIGEPEYLAGRFWQLQFERSQIGSVQAVDISKEPVDGGKFPDLLTDGQRNALMALRSASSRLATSVPGDKGRGLYRIRLIADVLGDGKFMRQIAAERGFSSRSAISALSREFKRSLLVLALEFGFVSGQRQSAKITGWRAAC